jgi:hypothetical protein
MVILLPGMSPVNWAIEPQLRCVKSSVAIVVPRPIITVSHRTKAVSFRYLDTRSGYWQRPLITVFCSPSARSGAEIASANIPVADIVATANFILGMVRT